jgi:hypothetical protein
MSDDGILRPDFGAPRKPTMTILRRPARCRHLKIEVDPEDLVVRCGDCEAQLDAGAVLLGFVRNEVHCAWKLELERKLTTRLLELHREIGRSEAKLRRLKKAEGRLEAIGARAERGSFACRADLEQLPEAWRP